MKMLKLKDSRGKESLTLGFTVVAFFAGTFGFVYSTLHGSTDLGGYGGFVFGSMMPWIVREWKEKDSVQSNTDVD